MAERKFTRNLSGPGVAAQQRQRASQAVRESTCLSKAKLIDPVEYENFIAKNKSVINNDPLRDMLLFPQDDVSASTIPREFRTLHNTVPNTTKLKGGAPSDLLVRESTKTYVQPWHVVNYKYDSYSEGYPHLPKAQPVNPDNLPDHVYELDVENEKDEQPQTGDNTSLSPVRMTSPDVTVSTWDLQFLFQEGNRAGQSFTKAGWLNKGPSSNQESTGTSLIGGFSKAFKKRYAYLKQQADTTYTLEFHKDDKKIDLKGTLFLDSACAIVKNAKKGKFAFDVQMQDGSFHSLATDTEREMDQWMSTLLKVIMTNEIPETDRPKDDTSSLGRHDSFMESLEESMHPELAKYAKESDPQLAQARKQNRQKLFQIYPQLHKSQQQHVYRNDKDVAAFREQFGTRFVVYLKEFRLRLQANIAEEGRPEKVDNPEPFFISFALYDAREGKKISEDFRVDPNSPEVRAMIPLEVLHGTDMLNSINGLNTQPELHEVDENWLLNSNKRGLFSVMNKHPEIYIVAKVDKVLQGSIASGTDPYIKTGGEPFRVGLKVHKHMRMCCARIGHYRMPFAWAARRVFKPSSGELDNNAQFVLFKQDPSKISEDDLIKHLQDIQRPEKTGKWQVIPASLDIAIEHYRPRTKNTLTSSLVPVKPFNQSDLNESVPTVEVEEFLPDTGVSCFSFSTYTNNLYVYPRSLKYDGQKAFTKGRNIACCIEFRDSDDENATPLKCIHGYPRTSVFTTVASAAVVHHQTSPEYSEEVKVALPSQLNEKHHLLFSFYHVSCESSVRPLSKVAGKGAYARRRNDLEIPIGYAWMPLLINGRVNVGDQGIPVATNKPSGYLSHEQFGLGRGSIGPDVKWVDGARPLFKFNLRLVSTVYTKDQHLHNFFQHCQKIRDTGSLSADMDTSNKLKSSKTGDQNQTSDIASDVEMLRYVKTLHAVESGTLIQFLPTVLNQLFRLLTQTNSEDVALNSVRVLIHIVSEASECDQTSALRSYAKFMFITEPTISVKSRTIHEELAKHLTFTLRPSVGDQLVISKFLKHSWFFFDVLIKSMAQHLLETARIKMSRNERFPSNYQYRIQNLVQHIVPHITQKCKDLPEETKNGNQSLAIFIKKCFTFMDRGFAFKLINMYIDNFNPGDVRILQEYKFEFLRIICSHEHYIPLNLPMMKRGHIKSYKANISASRAGFFDSGVRNMANKFVSPARPVFVIGPQPPRPPGTGSEVTAEDMRHDYTLSEEFRKNHFLVGLLLQEVKAALNEVKVTRSQAIFVLRDLLAKHAYDDRYANKPQQGRIASLYLPFITIILENKHRLNIMDGAGQPSPSATNGDTVSEAGDRSSIAPPSLTSHRSTVSLQTDSAGQTVSSGTGSVKLPKDSAVLAMIAGTAATPSSGSHSMSDPKGMTNGSSTSLSSSKGSSDQSMDKAQEGKDTPKTSAKHDRSQSMSVGPASSPVGVPRYDKLDQNEVKDLLICFLYIVKNLPEEVLLGWFNNSSEYDVMDFLNILEMCLLQFRYAGKKIIHKLSYDDTNQEDIIGDSTRKAQTLPYTRKSTSDIPPGHSRATSDQRTHSETFTHSEASAMFSQLLASNFASEVGLIVLDIIALYSSVFKEQLQYREGDNPIMQKVFDLYMSFLQTCQSEYTLKHTFAALRSFVNKFAKILFKGNAVMCANLCYELLRCCNSRLTSTRNEACALLYLLMRSNYEFNKKKSFTRVHLQVIVSVSQLISDVGGLSTIRFQESLSIINNYANSDKGMQRTCFPLEVKELTKKIRTVLMATAQMKEHQRDPEMLVDLQYSLAKSYSSTPELRKTWLDSMARIHRANGNMSEAAHCYIHGAALVAEYLKRRGAYPQGCRAFKAISSNVEPDESEGQEDFGMQDVQYTNDHLIEMLEDVAQALEKAERYEVLAEVYKLIIPVYEERRDYHRLSVAYQTLFNAYQKIVEVTHSGKRLLGKFFRVAFFGQNFFEEEDGKIYIYKEPKITGLNEICDRLKNLYTEKFGRGTVRLLSDSNKVNYKDLDSRYAYVQVTYVTPYFDERELEERQTDFERNNNVRRFMFETPFTKDPKKPHGSIEEQCKRRTILTTSHSFPYVKKRIQVVYHQDLELTPIEVAIDEMRKKVAELQEVVSLVTPDVKKLQLKLQGSVSVQVNAGPLAYAQAFLEKSIRLNRKKVESLKDMYRQFVQVCGLALEINGTVITTDQMEYQESLKENFRNMVSKLEDIFDEKLFSDDDGKSIDIDSHRASLGLFNVISSTSGSSNA